eukprot:13912106-Alexandrium_andersonii.AAC.1
MGEGRQRGPWVAHMRMSVRVAPKGQQLRDKTAVNRTCVLSWEGGMAGVRWDGVGLLVCSGR